MKKWEMHNRRNYNYEGFVAEINLDDNDHILFDNMETANLVLTLLRRRELPFICIDLPKEDKKENPFSHIA